MDEARCEDARKRIEAVYGKYAPERLVKVEALLKKYKGREDR